MPHGLNLSFVKAGRVSVPLELYFAPAVLPAKEAGQEPETTTKWPTIDHWKETREMLKPVLELALKCHQDSTGAFEKHIGDPIFLSGKHVNLGYMIQINNKYMDIFDSQDSWPDEDEYNDDDNSEADENMGLRDFGTPFQFS